MPCPPPAKRCRRMEEALRHRPRGFGRQSRSKRALRSAPQTFRRFPSRCQDPSSRKVRSMKSREYGGSTIGYWEMRISRLTLSFMSRPPISTSPSPNSFRPGGSVPCPPASGRSLSCARAFVRDQIDMPNRAPFPSRSRNGHPCLPPGRGEGRDRRVFCRTGQHSSRVPGARGSAARVI